MAVVQGAEIIELIVDGGESAKILNRPGMNNEWIRAGFIVGGPDRVAEQAQKLLDAGLDGLIFNMPHFELPEAIDLAGKTLAGLHQPAAAR